MNDLPGAWGDAFVVHEPKNKRVERFDPHARGPTMYLGPNKIRKDAHYFYDPKTRKVLTRRSSCQCKISLPTQVYMLVYEYLGYRR